MGIWQTDLQQIRLACDVHDNLAVLRIRTPDPVSGLNDPWIRDPVLVKNQDPGSGMNIPDHISEKKTMLTNA
jgi:hypothetical protein